MMFSVIGQPVPLLLGPQELNNTIPVTTSKLNKIIFFILVFLKVFHFAKRKYNKRFTNVCSDTFILTLWLNLFLLMKSGLTFF